MVQGTLKIVILYKKSKNGIHKLEMWCLYMFLELFTPPPRIFPFDIY